MPNFTIKNINKPLVYLWLIAFIATTTTIHGMIMPFITNLQQNNNVLMIFNGITMLGVAKIYLIPMGLACIIYFGKNRHKIQQTIIQPITKMPIFLQTIIILPTILIIAKIAKILIGHARPQEILSMQPSPNFWAEYYGPTFSDAFHALPSGHTTTAATVAILIAGKYPRFTGLAYAMTALVMTSRVVLLEHQASDVIATIIFVMITLPAIADTWNYFTSKYKLRSV